MLGKAPKGLNLAPQNRSTTRIPITYSNLTEPTAGAALKFLAALNMSLVCNVFRCYTGTSIAEK